MLETCRKVAIKIRPGSGDNGPCSVFQMVLVMPPLSADQSCSATETLHWELAVVGEQSEKYMAMLEVVGRQVTRVASPSCVSLLAHHWG